MRRRRSLQHPRLFGALFRELHPTRRTKVRTAIKMEVVMAAATVPVKERQFQREIILINVKCGVESEDCHACLHAFRDGLVAAKLEVFKASLLANCPSPETCSLNLDGVFAESARADEFVVGNDSRAVLINRLFHGALGDEAGTFLVTIRIDHDVESVRKFRKAFRHFNQLSP